MSKRLRSASITAAVVALASAAAPLGRSQDPPAIHGMLLVGEQPAFLLHLPMFQDPADLERVPPRRMPHRYQAILEVAFTGPDEPHQAYLEDRREHPDAKIYTIAPEAFVLPDLTAEEPRQSFEADVFRGHFEKGGEQILGGVEVNVKRVVHFREFDPQAEESRHLEYLLFGGAGQLFAAHLITGPPDFDHVLRVESVEREFSDEELAKGVRLVFPGIMNSAADRLKPDQPATATIAMDSDPAESAEIELETGEEIYFEEGELRLPAEFETTALEEAAGFP